MVNPQLCWGDYQSLTNTGFIVSMLNLRTAQSSKIRKQTMKVQSSLNHTVWEYKLCVAAHNLHYVLLVIMFSNQ
jgi:hypothetical protein